MKILGKIALATVAAVSFGSVAQAGDFSLSVYGGYQTAPHSGVSGNDGVTDFDFTTGWKGKSFEMPPYYGVRGTWCARHMVGAGQFWLDRRFQPHQSLRQ